MFIHIASSIESTRISGSEKDLNINAITINMATIEMMFVMMKSLSVTVTRSFYMGASPVI